MGNIRVTGRKTKVDITAYQICQSFKLGENIAEVFYSFVDGKPHPLSTDSISHILKKASDKARKECNAVPANVYCHLIRKTRVMDLYQGGIPLPIIAQTLGHECISTTGGFYAFATLGMMYDAMAKANKSASSEEKIWKTLELVKVLYTLD